MALPGTKNTRFKFRLNVRPVKHAFFISTGDWDSFERAAALLCTQWGGLCSLIIPFDPDSELDSLYTDLLTLHEPDRFVYFGEEKDTGPIRVHLQRALSRIFPGRSSQVLDGGVFAKHDETAHPLAAWPLQTPKPILKTYALRGRKPETVELLAIFGRIFPGQKGDYSQVFEIMMEEMSYGRNSFWEAQLSAASLDSPINLTRYGFHARKIVNPSDSNHFDVVVGGTLTSLCMYWSFRAHRESTSSSGDQQRRTVFLPKRLLVAERLEELATVLRLRLYHPMYDTDLHVRFQVWEEEEIEATKSALRHFLISNLILRGR